EEQSGVCDRVRRYVIVEHRYFKSVVRQRIVRVIVGSWAHVTGGGLPGNVPRSLPEGCGVRLRRGSWEVPEVFALIAAAGAVAEEEMYDVLNMGLGFVLVVGRDDVEEALALAPGALPVGEVVAGSGVAVV